MKLEYEEAIDALAVAEYQADVDEATEHLTAAINALVKVDADNMMAYLAAALLALTAGAAVTCRRKIKNVR